MFKALSNAFFRKILFVFSSFPNFSSYNFAKSGTIVVKPISRRNEYVIKISCSSKKSLTVVKESCTLEEAIKILEESGYRCVPVLDETETFFRGNIYKMHIYRHKANGDMSLPVTHLIKNSTKFISVDSSFFKVFFTIKELPLHCRVR